MIKRFKETEGRSIEEIKGAKDMAFCLTDNTDFFDLPQWAEHGGYMGNEIIFYNLLTGDVFTPFQKEKNVIYSKPKCLRGEIYFLKGNYTEKELYLLKYSEGEIPEVITELKMDELELYNLNIIGEEVHIVSQDKEFKCYYPNKISIPLRPHETVILIDEGKVYSTEWVEEGWDDLNDCATEDYKYYDKLIIRNSEGEIISEEAGSLFKDDDGTWWIA